MEITYRLAVISDIDEVCGLIGRAIDTMENNRIFQWDELYPTRKDFIGDIAKGELFVGIMNSEIAVVYTVNKECDVAYDYCSWKYTDCEYRIIHRLCVDPKYQNMGIAKRTLYYIEKELKEKSVEAVRLDVFGNNPFAAALYLNNGYEKAGTADWRKGRFWLMEKHL